MGSHNMEQDHAWLTALRRDIHQHPELAFRETRTAEIVARELTRMGIPFRTGIGGTGVVGTLSAGTSGHSIALRADMDALPMQEDSGVPHQSVYPGAFHGCGHDGHTAMLLGAAEQLSRTRAFDGTVHFIFQPAEEGEGGAVAMLNDGLLRDFPAEQIFGLHNWPGMPLGHFATRPGPMMAAFAKFDIRIDGKGGHAALPHESTDQILAASALVQALQSIVSRTLNPIDPAVVSVTQFHAGSAYNVLPGSAALAGCTRYFSDAAGETIAARLRAIAAETAATFDATAEVCVDQVYTALVNDAAAARLCADVAASLVGSAQVDADCAPIMASEDFAFMLRERPGCYILMGTGDGDHGCMVHNPAYDFNDAALPIGVSYWVRLVETRLAG
ncbi:M20 aminoacylase family protein [Sphingosinicella sp.]|uniref:M20 aminoacylase family protein n=1 Tax=Sphingosinicella sp. TaxID=1917971 RepID=UPI0035B164B0